jgi:hypothetical protein
VDTAELLAGCDRELQALHALGAAAADKQAALLAGDPAAIRAAADREAAALGAWRQAAEARQAAVGRQAAALGAAADLQAVAAALPEAEAAAVRRRRQELAQALQELRRRNRQNQLLAHHSLAVIAFSLRSLLGDADGVYGAARRLAPRPRLVDQGV